MNIGQQRLFRLLPIVVFLGSIAYAQHEGANYDEQRVGTYSLPDPLVFSNGEKIRTPSDWWQRRQEILRLYREQVHGFDLPRPTDMTWAVVEESRNSFGGKALRKQIEVDFFGTGSGPKMLLLMYVPAARAKPVPCFLCLSFDPPYQVSSESAVRMTPTWDRKNKVRLLPQDSSRGKARGWDLGAVLSRGYGIVIVYYCDIEPDFPGGWKYGVRRSLAGEGKDSLPPDAPGAIGVWAWGLSRAMDYLQTDRDVDAKHVILMGHSRLGKTVLWAAAQDERFAAVVANGSGEMGGALSRRNFGETVDAIIARFPYWFCGNFAHFRGRVNNLPVDAHFLLALIAPRPVLLNTGSEDLWADPRGELLAAVAATPVYRLLGASGIETEEFPPLNTTIGHAVSFRCHAGKHEVTQADWQSFVEFADREVCHLSAVPLPTLQR